MFLRNLGSTTPRRTTEIDIMKYFFIFLLLVTTCLAIPILPPPPNSGSTVLTTTTIRTSTPTTISNTGTPTTIETTIGSETTIDDLGDALPEIKEQKQDNIWLYVSIVFSFLELLVIIFLLSRLKLKYDELQAERANNQNLMMQQSRAQQNNLQNAQQNYPPRKF